VGPVTFTAANGLPAPLTQSDGTSTVLVGFNSAFVPTLTGTVALGTVGIPVPASALPGQRYTLAVSEPSGTTDGTNDLLGAPGPNGTLEVGVPFLVCDVQPRTGSGLNQGEFGNGSILNSDVVAVFRSSLLPAERPAAGTALFSAMDAAPEDVPPACGGNASIVNSDVVLCFRRSLLPTLPRYRRTGVGASCTSSLPGGGSGSAFAEAPSAFSVRIPWPSCGRRPASG